MKLIITQFSSASCYRVLEWKSPKYNLTNRSDEKYLLGYNAV
jgi:hypothetical protein